MGVAGNRRGSGTLAAGNGNDLLESGSGADRVLYDTSTGILYYDTDGLGGKPEFQVAALDDKAAITAADIRIV